MDPILAAAPARRKALGGLGERHLTAGCNAAALVAPAGIVLQPCPCRSRPRWQLNATRQKVEPATKARQQHIREMDVHYVEARPREGLVVRGSAKSGADPGG